MAHAGASRAPCSRGCGWTAYGGYQTCCTTCRGPEGPHAKDCDEKNVRLRTPCGRNCGRPAFGSFKTCCTRCAGREGPHTSDCAEKCRQSPPPAPVAPAPVPGGPAAAGYGGACGPVAPAGASVLGRCGHCGEAFPVLVPPGAGAGARVGVVCPACRKPTEICLGGPGPALVPALGGPRPTLPGQRRRALLVGINYVGTRAQLRGCVNDVRNVHELLVKTFGWPSDCIRTLTDEDADPRRAPTKRNIQANLQWLAHGNDGVRPGDVLFFHFSGHGAQKEDPNGFEEDGMNETILPVDFQSAGMMTDDEITEIVVRPLPEHVKLTAVMDCCHSGTGLDLPFRHTPGGPRGWRAETNPWLQPSDVQLFSGCEDATTSADATRYGRPGGAMTTALCDVLRANQCPSYPDLMSNLARVMQERRFAQRPQLTSSQQFHLDRPFVLTDIHPNTNLTLGRVINQHFKPRPRPISTDDPLGSLLAELGLSPPAAAMAAGIAGAIGGLILGKLFDR